MGYASLCIESPERLLNLWHILWPGIRGGQTGLHEHPEYVILRVNSGWNRFFIQINPAVSKVVPKEDWVSAAFLTLGSKRVWGKKYSLVMADTRWRCIISPVDSGFSSVFRTLVSEWLWQYSEKRSTLRTETKVRSLVKGQIKMVCLN